MTGRAHESKSVLNLFGKDEINCGNGSTSRQFCYSERRRTDDRIEVNKRNAPLAKTPHLLQQSGIVTAFDVGIFCRLWRDFLYASLQGIIASKRRSDSSESRRIFRVLPGFMS